jgi:hypothetical protein
VRGATLAALLTGLRAETRVSLNVAHNIQVRDTQIYQLQRVQEQLADDYTWPHLRVYRYIQLSTGQRYYDPTGCLKYDNTNTLVAAGDMSIDNVSKVFVRDGSVWRPIDPGITEEHFNAYNSDTAEASWPPRRWDMAETNQIELWPIPSLPSDLVNGENLLRLHGIRNLGPLKADTDTADLDDRLLTLMAAAEILGGEEGKKKAALANRRLLKIRGKTVKKRSFKMFGDKTPERVLRGPPTVYYRTGS